MLRRELNITMRRLWRNTFDEVSMGGGIAPRKLILENWHPRPVPTFQSQERKNYRSMLESFEVHLMTSTLDGGRARKIITRTGGYVHSVRRIGEFFFRHIDGLEKLTVSMGGLGMPADSQASVMFGVARHGAYVWGRHRKPPCS